MPPFERQISCDSFGFTGFFVLAVIPDADEVAGWGEGIPGDVEPAVAGEELVGESVGLQEGDEAVELGRVLRADVGGLAFLVLGVLDASDHSVDARVAEARVDDDGAGLPSGRLQEQAAAIGHVGNLLGGGDVVGVLLPVAELRQREVR